LKRLFLGTFLPEEEKLRLKEVREANENLAERFRAKVRWVKDQKLHLTWLFLGDLDEEAIERLQNKIALALDHYQPDNIDSPAAETGKLLYDHLEIWFTHGLPRHLVLTPSAVAPQTLNLIEHVRKSCIDFVHADYQAQAGGNFRPHITLLRFEKDGAATPNLPFAETPGSHPLTPSRRVKARTLASDGLNKIASFLPMAHHLSTLAIIVSERDGSDHRYSILRSFDLTWKS
jgi:2'-5' RNA ligase